MRLYEYIKALAPSKGRRWFLAITTLFVPALQQLLRKEALESYQPTVPELGIIEAAILIVVLFVLGYLAWSEERAKNDREWTGLNFEQREMITESVTGTNKLPEVWMYNSDRPDCKRLGGDLFHSLDPVWRVARALTDDASAPIPSGFLIQAGRNDERAEILQRSLKKLGIDAKINHADGASFAILIGSKIR
jgi:hypothetical protein